MGARGCDGRFCCKDYVRALPGCPFVPPSLLISCGCCCRMGALFQVSSVVCELTSAGTSVEESCVCQARICLLLLVLPVCHSFADGVWLVPSCTDITIGKLPIGSCCCYGTNSLDSCCPALSTLLTYRGSAGKQARKSKAVASASDHMVLAGPLVVDALRPLTEAPLDTHLMIVEPEQRVGEDSLPLLEHWRLSASYSRHCLSAVAWHAVPSGQPHTCMCALQLTSSRLAVTSSVCTARVQQPFTFTEQSIRSGSLASLNVFLHVTI